MQDENFDAYDKVDIAYTPKAIWKILVSYACGWAQVWYSFCMCNNRPSLI